MNFTLTFNGDLKAKAKAKGSKEHKQEIRRVFHLQLLELWNHTSFGNLKYPPDSLTKTIGEYRFFPLVCKSRREVAELQILLLRPERGPGYIVGEGGDIDNRLKTLLDSLRMPKNEGEIPSDHHPGVNEDPFYCLLEDDILITKLAVSTDRLLEQSNSNSYVKLFIHVEIKQLPQIGANMIGKSLRLG
jgi:hypothetical protein